MKMAVLPLLCLLLPGPTGAQPPEPPIPKATALEEETQKVLKGATTVEAFVLGPAGKAKPETPTLRWGKRQYPVKETAKPKGEAFAAKLRALLTDPRTRRLGSSEPFKPTAAFRLSAKDKASVTVLIDFKGFNLLLITRDGEGKEVEVNGGGLFDFNGELGLQALLLVEAFYPKFPNPWMVTEAADLEEKTKEILKKATRVEVFRVHPRPAAMAGARTIEGYAIKEAGKDRDKGYAVRVSGVVLNPKTRGFSGAGSFLPTAAFRLSAKGEGSVTVLWDLERFQYLVRARDAKGNLIEDSQGNFLSVTRAEYQAAQQLVEEALPRPEKKP